MKGYLKLEVTETYLPVKITDIDFNASGDPHSVQVYFETDVLNGDGEVRQEAWVPVEKLYTMYPHALPIVQDEDFWKIVEKFEPKLA